MMAYVVMILGSFAQSCPTVLERSLMLLGKAVSYSKRPVEIGFTRVAV